MQKKLNIISTILDVFVSLNTFEGEFDPEIENRKAELFIELQKGFLLVMGEDDPDFSNAVNGMHKYATNSQFYTIQQEVLRPLLSSDNTEVNALRILLFTLARSLKTREDGDLDSVDETYYEDENVLYINRDKLEPNSEDDNLDLDSNDE